jgi:hypothetical protein
VLDNFVWVQDVVAKVAEVCEKLKANIVMTEVARDRGVTYVLDYFNNGHDKQGHQLQDNRWVYASYFSRYVLPAKATVNEIQAISAGIYDLCKDGKERILAKGNKGTQLVTYYCLRLETVTSTRACLYMHLASLGTFYSFVCYPVNTTIDSTYLLPVLPVVSALRVRRRSTAPTSAPFKRFLRTAYCFCKYRVD